MAPIRRYLRITRYSVLEVRIYLDNPADAHRWLLKTGDPALPRVMQAVRPLVLPKLREENERAKKSGKKKGVKDVVVRDDFEVSIFLTELSTSHDILSRHKVLSGKKTGDDMGTRDAPVDVDEGVDADGGVDAVLREEEEDDDAVHMDDISHLPSAGGNAVDDAVSLSEGSESDALGEGSRRSIARQKASPQRRPKDDKKKMGMSTAYDGFRIYGRILCLVIKRKGISKGKQLEGGAGQAMMEDWISSTQAGEGRMMDD